MQTANLAGFRIHRAHTRSIIVVILLSRNATRRRGISCRPCLSLTHVYQSA